MPDLDNANQATPDAVLECRIMDSNIPKNEQEHWAANEIHRLRDILGGGCPMHPSVSLLDRIHSVRDSAEIYGNYDLAQWLKRHADEAFPDGTSTSANTCVWPLCGKPEFASCHNLCCRRVDESRQDEFCGDGGCHPYTPEPAPSPHFIPDHECSHPIGYHDPKTGRCTGGSGDEGCWCVRKMFDVIALSKTESPALVLTVHNVMDGRFAASGMRAVLLTYGTSDRTYRIVPRGQYKVGDAFRVQSEALETGAGVPSGEAYDRMAKHALSLGFNPPADDDRITYPPDDGTRPAIEPLSPPPFTAEEARQLGRILASNADFAASTYVAQRLRRTAEYLAAYANLKGPRRCARTGGGGAACVNGITGAYQLRLPPHFPTSAPYSSAQRRIADGDEINLL